MIAPSPCRRTKRTAGGTLVEFGLVTVILVTLLVGVVEVSMMLLEYTAIANAARAGVRYASLHGNGRNGISGSNGESGPGNNPPQVLAVVKNYATAGLLTLSDSDITVTYSPSNTAGSTVTVTVSHTYSSLIPYFQTSLNARVASTSKGVIVF